MTRIHFVCIVAFTTCCLLTIHARSSAQDAAKAAFDAIFKKGKTLRNEGKHAESVSAFEKSLALAEKLFGKDDINTAQVESYLGVALRSAGRSNEANEQYREAARLKSGNPP